MGRRGWGRGTPGGTSGVAGRGSAGPARGEGRGRGWHTAFQRRPGWLTWSEGGGGSVGGASRGSSRTQVRRRREEGGGRREEGGGCSSGPRPPTGAGWGGGKGGGGICVTYRIRKQFHEDDNLRIRLKTRYHLFLNFGRILIGMNQSHS